MYNLIGNLTQFEIGGLLAEMALYAFAVNFIHIDERSMVVLANIIKGVYMVVFSMMLSDYHYYGGFLGNFLLEV